MGSTIKLSHRMYMSKPNEIVDAVMIHVFHVLIVII